MKSLIVIVFLLITSFAFAGGSDRGGGNALVCFSNPAITKQIRDPHHSQYGIIADSVLDQIDSIEMLDLYQAKLSNQSHGIPKPIVELPESSSIEGWDYAVLLSDRIANFVPALYFKILQSRTLLARNIHFSSNGVAKIDDTNLLFDFDRENCVIATMAAQDPQNEALFIDQRLFNHPRHSLQSRGVMWLHEWIYFHLLKKQMLNSSGVRMIIGKMLSPGMVNAADLIRSSSQAGILDANEQYNGVQGQLKTASDRALNQFVTASEFAWTVSDYDPVNLNFWNFYSRYSQELKTTVSCMRLQDCEGEIQRLLGATVDESHKRKLEFLLSRTKSYKQDFTFGQRVMSGVSLWLDSAFMVGPVSSEYPLPQDRIDQAKEKLFEALQRLASRTDQNILILTNPTSVEPNYEEYRRSRIQLRQRLLDDVKIEIESAINSLRQL